MKNKVKTVLEKEGANISERKNKNRFTEEKKK